MIEIETRFQEGTSCQYMRTRSVQDDPTDGPYRDRCGNDHSISPRHVVTRMLDMLRQVSCMSEVFVVDLSMDLSTSPR